MDQDAKSLAGPSFSQVPAQPTRKVFVDHSGQPLRTFIEASSVPYRPQYLRTLRSNGGVVCRAPGEAQLLFVDQTTDASKEIESAWSSETGKVILDVEWITKSVQRGHALLASEGWGGFLVTTGGPPPFAEQDVGNIYKSPLPTPRQTPSEPVAFNGSQASNNSSAQVGTNAQSTNAWQSLSDPINQVQAHPQVINPQSADMDSSTPSQLLIYPPSTPQSMSPGLSLTLPTILQSSDTISAPPLDQLSRLSLKRKSMSSEPEAISHRSKGKGRPERPSKLKHLSNTSDDLANEPSTSSISVQAPVSTSTPDKNAVFISKSGEPLQFMVQIDIRNRGELIQTIKQYQGKVTSDVTKADFVVVSHTSSSFENMLRMAENADRIAVPASFIQDCVDEHTLLDADEYSFEGMILKKKRGRQPTKFSPVVRLKKNKLQVDRSEKAPKSRSDEKQEQQQIAVVKKEPKANSNMTVKKEEKPPDVLPPTPPPATPQERSPTPPTQVVAFTAGKNLYSEEDRNYVLRYLPILLARQPDMPMSVISAKLYAKMPHHSEKSWNAHLSQNRNRETIENFRKKAFIAMRKAGNDRSKGLASEAQHAGPSTPSTSQVSNEQSSHAQQPRLSPSLPSNAWPGLNPFDTMVEFFASGGADELTDTQTFEKLAELYPHLNAKWWHDYWDSNDEKVSEEVLRRRQHGSTG